jgi:diaminopimelate decarboxylase
MSEIFDPHEWSTPLYAYDLALVREAVVGLRSQLPRPSDLFYSLKANPHPEIVRAAHEAGSRAEVSSLGELHAAREAGVPGEDILYTGPGKTVAEDEAALSQGVRLFSVDSPGALERLETVARRHGSRVRYLIRVNPTEPVSSAGLRMTGIPSQFGADGSFVSSSPERFVNNDNLQFYGLHLYLATNLSDQAALVEQFRVAVRTASELERRLSRPLRLLDLGGGFGAPYARSGSLPVFPALAGQLGAVLDEHFPRWRRGNPTVAFESGRYLTSTSGRLYTRVVDTKNSHGRRVVVVDSGIHHLGGMAGLRRVPQIRVDVAAEAVDRTARPDPAMVCGPLCTPLDTWARDAPLPPVGPGDMLVVPNVGAYGLSASLALFLGHPMPTELALDGSCVVSATQLTVRRRTLPATTPIPAPVTVTGG